MKGSLYSQALGSLHLNPEWLCSFALELLRFGVIFLRFREKIELGCKPCCASSLL